MAMRFQLLTSLAVLLVPGTPSRLHAQAPAQVLFENVRIWDGTSDRLSPVSWVLVEDNLIKRISPAPITAAPSATRIDGRGRTLIPGLIDVHVHLTFSSLSQQGLMDPGMTPEKAAAAASAEAERMLLRGFTSVRDMGGPIFELKAAIDAGRVAGPRVWPSGATISQTAGHGDFRLPSERSRRFFGKASRAEEMGATFIADGRDEVLTATRENLRFGASQIKLMAGGGTSSAYDPVDVTQYTLDEMKAAVEAAQDWGTYVAVHAYTPRAVRRAIEAGVKCIEHGQLLDRETLALMARRGTWLSGQNLVEDTPDMDPLRREKRKPVLEGQARVWPMAKQLGVKLAWGTDFLFEPELNAQQNAYILRLKPWFSALEILRMVTHDNAQLLALSGLRSPYRGTLGVVKEGALADLLLVNGDPLGNIDVVGDAANFVVIMKDGRIFKNHDT